MWRWRVTRTTKDAVVALPGALFSLDVALDRVAEAVQPSLALHTLDDEVTFVVGLGAGSAGGVRGTRSALRVVLLPLAVGARIVGAAGLALGAPFAFPGALGHLLQRRFYAVRVEADVAVVAEYKARLVVPLAATFAHRTVQASPALLQYHLRHFDVGAVRVVALSALGAGDETALLIGADRAAHHADILR